MIVYAGHERLRRIGAQLRAGQANQSAAEIGSGVWRPAPGLENKRAISAAEQAANQAENWKDARQNPSLRPNCMFRIGKVMLDIWPALPASTLLFGSDRFVLFHEL